jgi:hypothetical protein
MSRNRLFISKSTIQNHGPQRNKKKKKKARKKQSIKQMYNSIDYPQLHIFLAILAFPISLSNFSHFRFPQAEKKAWQEHDSPITIINILISDSRTAVPSSPAHQFPSPSNGFENCPSKCQYIGPPPPAISANVNSTWYRYVFCLVGKMSISFFVSLSGFFVPFHLAFSFGEIDINLLSC